MHNEKDNEHKNKNDIPKGALPTYLLDRQQMSKSKILSNTIKPMRMRRNITGEPGFIFKIKNCHLF